MPQITFSVQMDESIKRQLDQLCQSFGMDTNTAITIFACAVIRQQKIPFDISAPLDDPIQEKGLQAFSALRAQAKANGVTGMTLKKINDEIFATRQKDENDAQ